MSFSCHVSFRGLKHGDFPLPSYFTQEGMYIYPWVFVQRSPGKIIIANGIQPLRQRHPRLAWVGGDVGWFSKPFPLEQSVGIPKRPVIPPKVRCFLAYLRGVQIPSQQVFGRLRNLFFVSKFYHDGEYVYAYFFSNHPTSKFQNMFMNMMIIGPNFGNSTPFFFQTCWCPFFSVHRVL